MTEVRSRLHRYPRWTLGYLSAAMVRFSPRFLPAGPGRSARLHDPRRPQRVLGFVLWALFIAILIGIGAR